MTDQAIDKMASGVESLEMFGRIYNHMAAAMRVPGNPVTRCYPKSHADELITVARHDGFEAEFVQGGLDRDAIGIRIVCSAGESPKRGGGATG